MKLAKLLAISVLACSISGSSTAHAQTTTSPAGDVPHHGFRAQGGLVNFAEGDIQCECAGEKKSVIHAGQELVTGDAIETGKDARAEILLSPGVYLRLSSNTRAVLMDLSSANLKLRLKLGSAIVEMAMIESMAHSFFGKIVYTPITMITPRDEYAIVKGGAYRFDVVGETTSNVKVIKGLAVVAGTSVSDEMTAAVVDGRVKLSAVEKSAGDIFDAWSRDRSAGLVEANKALRKADWYKQLKKDHAYNEVVRSDGVVEASLRHTVSARNGYVAFVESATVLNPDEPNWKELKAGDNLVSGARVRTEPVCRAQLQPFPGVDLYLASGTEIVYLEQQEGRVAIKLIKGSVIVITHLEEKSKEPNVFTLMAESIEYETSAQGRFRLNMLENQSALLVFEGLIRVPGKVVKAQKKILRSGTEDVVTKIDEKAKDSFDIWSNRRSMLPGLASFKDIMASIGGLWLLSPSTGEYTFVPALREYSTPYGGWYGTTYMSMEDYRPVMRPPGFPPRASPF